MPDNNSKSTTAWISKIQSTWVSVGRYEIKMLLKNPEMTSVIGASRYFDKFLIFKNNLIPVIDIDGFLHYQECNSETNIFGVITFYNHHTCKVEYGAIKFNDIPQSITVTNDMQIDIQQSDDRLTEYSKALFQYDQKAVHVLDLNKIFNTK